MRACLGLLVAIGLLIANPRCAAARNDGNLEELSRIQTGLNRAASGLPVDVSGSDPLERVVEAFSAGWARPDADPANALPILAAVEVEVTRRADAVADAAEQDYQKTDAQALRTYVARLSGESEPLARFVATLHQVDAVLIAEQLAPVGFDYANRPPSADWMSDPKAAQAWLRVPCREILGRGSAFRQVFAALGDVAGPVLDCPVAHEAASDVDRMAHFAHNPGRDARALVSKPLAKPAAIKWWVDRPSTPPNGAWTEKDAASFMETNPAKAEAVFRRSKDPIAELDYALFLYAFHPPSAKRNAMIARLLGHVDAAEGDGNGEGDPPLFNGSDRSLVEVLKWTSEAGIAKTNSAGYAIPCAVLLRKPVLLAALDAYYGSQRDAFLPRSGCETGRGFVRGFPQAAVQRFIDAAEGPTHNFVSSFEGTMRFGLYRQIDASLEVIRVDPRRLLAHAPAITPAAPYRVWSYLSLDNRRVQARTQAAFKRAKSAVADYFRHRGLSTGAADRAADKGLRDLALGTECGSATAPPASFRTLLLDGASLPRIKAFAASGAWKDPARTQSFFLCAHYAGMEPLIHVAVVRPDALSFLWDLAAREPDAAGRETLDLDLDPNAANAFGKTPLMTAAQFDQPESIRLLLARGADPNARTDAGTTAWARRTALMYAAAKASLPTIKRLLAAGADPQAADTKGLKPLHYLLGYGPVPPNPKLSRVDLAEAVRLLF